MTRTIPAPEAERIADAVTDHWVDTRAPARLRPYLRLSRVERPIGTWLLLIPCWWGLALAMLADGPRWFDLWIALACAVGAFLMRGAGCTWNDITDRNIDGAVERTAKRPIPSGAVTVKQALLWMGLQCVLALFILLTFNGMAIGLGFLAMLPVAIYPFAKRFTWWPQAFLGLAFNWGALLAYAAHSGGVGWSALLLYAAGIAWTLFYDTIYAHQDAEDDALIGVKSTARLFGGNSVTWLRWFLGVTVVFFAFAVISATSGWARVVGLGAPLALGLQMAWQLSVFDPDDGPGLLRLFRSNSGAGLISLIFLITALLV